MKTNNKIYEQKIVLMAHICILTVMIISLEFIRRYDLIPAAYIASFSELIKILISDKLTNRILSHIYTTVIEITIGFALAVSIGIIAGIIIYLFRTIYIIVNPLLVIAMSLPVVALAPLFVIWFGIDILSKIILVFIAAVFPITINVVSGLYSLDRFLGDSARATGLSKLQSILYVELPCAQPAIFVGLKIGLSKGIVASIVGEMIASKKGIGWMLGAYSGMFRADVVLLCIFILFIISYLFNKIIEKCYQLRISKWGRY